MPVRSINLLFTLHYLHLYLHSRSFILQLVTGRQGVACRHIILLALNSEDSEEVATQSAKNCRHR